MPRPRRDDWRTYYRVVNSLLLRPAFTQITRAILKQPPQEWAEMLGQALLNESWIAPLRIQLEDAASALNRQHAGRFRRLRLLPGNSLDFFETDRLRVGFVDNGIDLIRTIPRNMHADLSRHMMSLDQNERYDRAKLRKLLHERYGVSRNRARVIARDQTSKLWGKLTEARQTKAGVIEYIWRTSRDDRVRPTHRENFGRIFRWSDPPMPTGHPGNDIICRCWAEPITDEAYVQTLNIKGRRKWEYAT